jgi:hypothetical protein
VDQTQFDAVTQTVRRLPSRRHVLRGLAGIGLGLGGLRLADTAEAKKQRKGKKKKAKKKQPKKRADTQPAFNEFGCLDIGQPCRGDSALCCSGVCQGAAPPGAPDTSTCVAHHTGVCKKGATTCEVGTLVGCVADDDTSICFRTTGNAAFCGSAVLDINTYCRVCAKDRDCEAEYGPGAACVVLDGICAGFCSLTGLTACLPPAV